MVIDWNINSTFDEHGNNKIMKKQEKRLFKLVHNFDHDNNYGLGVGVHLGSDERDKDDIQYRVYAERGWCLDVKREKVCEPSEVAELKDPSIDKKGYQYSFYSWTELDGFKDTELSEALELFETTVQS